MISEQWIGKSVEGSGHDLVLKYYFDISFEGLRKAMKNLGQLPGRDLNF
jgi:hypothetical protein